MEKGKSRGRKKLGFGTVLWVTPAALFQSGSSQAASIVRMGSPLQDFTRLCTAVFAKAGGTFSGTVFFPVNVSFLEKGPWATILTEVLKSWLLSLGFLPVEVKTPALRPQLHLSRTILFLSHLPLSPGYDSHHSGDCSHLPSLRDPLRRNM